MGLPLLTVLNVVLYYSADIGRNIYESQVFDNVYSTIVLTSTVGGRKIYKGQVLKWESVLVSFGDFWCQFPLLYNTIVSCFFFADHNTAQVSHLGSWAGTTALRHLHHHLEFQTLTPN